MDVHLLGRPLPPKPPATPAVPTGATQEGWQTADFFSTFGRCVHDCVRYGPTDRMGIGAAQLLYVAASPLLLTAAVAGDVKTAWQRCRRG